jgi:hypothetical protein
MKIVLIERCKSLNNIIKTQMITQENSQEIKNQQSIKEDTLRQADQTNVTIEPIIFKLRANIFFLRHSDEPRSEKITHKITYSNK